MGAKQAITLQTCVFSSKLIFWIQFKMVYDDFNRAHGLENHILSLFEGAVLSRMCLGRVWDIYYASKLSLTNRALPKMRKHRIGSKNAWFSSIEYQNVRNWMNVYSFKCAQYHTNVSWEYGAFTEIALWVCKHNLIYWKPVIRLDQNIGREPCCNRLNIRF